MGWDFGRGVPKGNAEGDIIGKAEIVPSKQALKDHRLAFEALNLSAFQFATIKTMDGNQVKLKFCAKTAEEGAAASLEAWLNNVGEEKGYLKIAYTQRSPKQDELDLEGEPAEEEEEEPEEEEVTDEDE